MSRKGLLSALAAASLPAVAGLLLAAPAARASPPGQPKPESVVQVRVERVRVRPGGAVQATLVASILAGFHINSNQPAAEYLIPSRVELAEPAGFVLEKAAYPAGELKSFGFAPDEKLSVYQGTVRIPVRLRARPETPAGKHSLRLVFHYQACNDQLCLRPARQEAKLEVQLPSGARPSASR